MKVDGQDVMLCPGITPGQSMVLLYLPAFRRYIMNIDMALQTIGKFLEHCVSMRFCMAFLAFWNISVLGMAFCARYLTVSAQGRLDFIVSRAVASAANSIPCCFRISDLEGRMNRMAGQTLFYGLICSVRLMALHT